MRELEATALLFIWIICLLAGAALGYLIRSGRSARRRRYKPRRLKKHRRRSQLRQLDL
jgi:hypothetical protein